ncbi:MAG: VOC family protein [Pseudomonadota bacterium]
MATAHARTAGAHHIGLTVADLHAAKHFFLDALGFEQVGEVADYPAVFVSDGTVMITLWRAEDPATASAFDRRLNLGLHHFALRVPGGDEALASLADDLARRDDVEIEFRPEALGTTPLKHMMVRIPGGNLRLELIAA